MGSKKIIAGVLSIAVVFAAVGIYWYKAKISADTKEVLVGTRMQMVDTAGAVIRNQVPLELTFNGTVRECKVTRVLFAKISKCGNKNRNFKRVAITSTDGTYTVGTESYRPLTVAEAKIVVESFAQEKMGRELNADEKARLGRLTDQAAGLATPTNEAVEGIAKNVFNDYTPPANDQTVTLSSSHPFTDALVTATTVGATVAAGSAVVAGAKVGATAVHMGASVGQGLQIGANVAKTTAGSTLTSAGHWLAANPVAIAAIVVLATISVKKTEKDFNLQTALVRPAGDIYKGEPVTLQFAADKYQKEGKLAIDLNDFDQAFYSQAADQLYAKFISSNEGISDSAKTNYKTLLAANVEYLQYARLHGYSEANANKDIAAKIKAIVDGQVANDNDTTDKLNMAKNGGFESGMENWIARHDGNGGAESIVTATSTFKCSTGSKCLKMVSMGNWQGAYQQIGHLDKGSTYRLTAYYRTGDEGATGRINLHDVINDKKYDMQISGDTTWKKITVEIPVVNDTNDYWIYLYGDGSAPGAVKTGTGTVYYDGIMLEKVISVTSN